MTRYVLSRIGQSLIVILIAYTVVFVLIHVLPSDQLTIIFNPEEGLYSAEDVEQLERYYGLDAPIWQQYFTQLFNLVHGDFGFSITTGQSVVERISSVVGSTLELALTALAFALILSAVLAYLVATRQSRRLRALLFSVPEFLSSVPTFFIGLIVLQIFSIQLGWIALFPDGSLLSLIIPAVVLAVPISAPISQVLLRGIDAARAEPYVQTARAKGLSPGAVFFGHVLKNVTGPFITVLGLQFGALLAGSVVTETVFSRHGLGGVLIQAVTTQDIALVQGLVLLTTVIVVALNLIVDLVYPILDPRILKTVSSRGATLALNT